MTHHDLLGVVDRLRAQAAGAATLEQAANGAIETIYAAFSGSLVLARMFVTVPFGTLPDELRRSAWSVVEAQGLHGSVHDRTPVLSLLSTRGNEAAWCDRRTSRGHAAIPLSSSSFVDSIPMIARMLQEMGLDLGLRAEVGSFVEKVLGAGWVGLFYVEDARTARDDQGRRIIPAADFVEKYHVRTVCGLGKAYANGSIVSFVFFTNTVLSRARVEALVPVVNAFKAATLDHPARGSIFDG